MNTFQCLVLVTAIGFIITTTTTVSANICYTTPNCEKGTNKTEVSSVNHHTTPS